MKKYLLIFTLLMISFCVSAQMITVIPKIGATISTVSMPDSDVLPILGSSFENEIKSKPGFTFGVALNYYINEMISIQPELSFIQKGYTEKSFSTYTEEFEGRITTFESSYKNSMTLNYLEIPVLARASFGRTTKFFFLIGPSLGVGLGGKAKSEGTTTESYDDEVDTYSYDDETTIKFGTPTEEDGNQYIDNRIDFGVQFGGGIFVLNKILIEARYGLGLSSLYDSDYDVKNRVFQVTVGIPLRLN